MSYGKKYYGFHMKFRTFSKVTVILPILSGHGVCMDEEDEEYCRRHKRLHECLDPDHHDYLYVCKPVKLGFSGNFAIF